MSDKNQLKRPVKLGRVSEKELSQPAYRHIFHVTREEIPPDNRRFPNTTQFNYYKATNQELMYTVIFRTTGYALLIYSRFKRPDADTTRKGFLSLILHPSNNGRR